MLLPTATKTNFYCYDFVLSNLCLNFVLKNQLKCCPNTRMHQGICEAAIEMSKFEATHKTGVAENDVKEKNHHQK